MTDLTSCLLARVLAVSTALAGCAAPGPRAPSRSAQVVSRPAGAEQRPTEQGSSSSAVQWSAAQSVAPQPAASTPRVVTAQPPLPPQDPPRAAPVASPASTSPADCSTIQRAWDDKVARRPPACRTHEQCGCVHGLRDEYSCVCSDVATAEELQTLATRYRSASCPWIPTRLSRGCLPRCVAGRCTAQE